MENASKALIIAGAILIAIVLITLGVVILGQGQDVVNNSNIDDVQVQQFNNKFTQYCGTKVTGANVNALLNAVVSNNAIATRDGENDKRIYVNVDGTSKPVGVATTSGTTATYGSDVLVGKILTKAQSGKVYNVSVTSYYPNNGYIKVITIK